MLGVCWLDPAAVLGRGNSASAPVTLCAILTVLGLKTRRAALTAEEADLAALVRFRPLLPWTFWPVL